MAKKPPNPISFAKQVLRSASVRWYARNEVYKRCQVSRGVYKCEGCGGHFTRKQLQIDHIEPVVDIREGFTTLDNWVLRLFVTPDKLQSLCHFEKEDGSVYGCHASKSSLENEMREFYKGQKKCSKKKSKKS